MKYLELQSKIKTNIFTYLDILKFFPEENPLLVKVQLSRFAQKKYITKIKRGLYCFSPINIDELKLANLLYQPSYISLESALNYYGIIPDIPQAITSITLITTKSIKNQFGLFSYTKIKPALFWGFKSASGENLFLAKKEKALLDYFYIRKIKSTSDLRLNLKNIDYKLHKKYLKYYPLWVAKVKL